MSSVQLIDNLTKFIHSTVYLGYKTVAYTGTSKKNENIMKKVNIFCHSFQKVKPILYRFITQSEILMIMAYR